MAGAAVSSSTFTVSPRREARHGLGRERCGGAPARAHLRHWSQQISRMATIAALSVVWHARSMIPGSAASSGEGSPPSRRWVSRALSDFRAVVFAGTPAAETIERGFLTYLGVLERERSTYLALAQLGHVSGPGADEHLASYIAAAGDVVTEVMYARFPGIAAGSELGRTWGQALAGMSHHVADRWVRTPWAPKEHVARSLARLVLPALEDRLHDDSTPP
jgi:hypothetical protein